jgi:hypothetical protein
LKMAKEIVQFKRNMMHIAIGDLEEYNQHVSDRIKKDFLELYSSFTSELKVFMKENTEQTFDRDFYISMDIKND